MKLIAFAIILCFLVTGVALAADSAKINLSAKAMTLKDATDQVAKQASISIVLDPKATGTVTATLNGAELGQVLDVITKSNNLTWKKLQFAHNADTKVSLDQLKSGILALASMPVIGLSVEDPATKKSAVFAKDIPTAPDTSKVALPDGYSWTTVYVVMSVEAPVTAADKTSADKIKALTDSQIKNVADLAGMTSAERKQIFQNQWAASMQLTPEARQAMFSDQMSAMGSLDPNQRNQLMQDMRTAMRSAFGGNGGGGNRGGGGGRTRGN